MDRNLDGFAADVAGHPESFAELFARMGYLPLLPPLELPFPEVAGRLISALTGAGIPEESARSVSLRELVGFAIERGSPYWVGRSVDWLQSGFPLDQDLADSLDRLIHEHPEWPQRLRHQASGLVRRWQRDQQGPS